VKDKVTSYIQESCKTIRLPGMENYISYTSVNIQAQPCFVTVHILAGKKNTSLETGVVWSIKYVLLNVS